MRRKKYMAKLDKDVLKMLEDEAKQTKSVDKIEVSNKSRLVAFLLCYMFGMFGAHRFYVGKKVTAVLYILTMGLFGIGLLVDILKIILGKFKDVEDNLITKWIED